MKTYYPRDNLLPTPEAMELWFTAIRDISYETATAFLHKWITTEKWAPTIAEIRSGCATVISGEIPEWGDAWNDVTKAVRRHGYMQPEKARKMMGELAWKAVDAIGGWQHFCESEDQMADRANFRQCFEAFARREQQDRVIPQQLKDTINNLRLGAAEKALLPQEGT